jgi:hypothetical protein
MENTTKSVGALLKDLGVDVCHLQNTVGLMLRLVERSPPSADAAYRLDVKSSIAVRSGQPTSELCVIPLAHWRSG